MSGISIILFLAAIAQVESGNHANAIGLAGERSAFQMTEETWRRYTADPFEWATTRPEEARRVAAEHARTISRLVPGHARPDAVPWMAHAWNPNAPEDYGRRVEVIYLQLLRQAH